VALVSLSLSIALALASGAEPVAGLATAAWGGIFGGALCSSRYNILGPAGALASTLSKDVEKWGQDIVPWIAMFSAGLCFVVYATGMQRYFLLMPKAVFEGFTVGVALSIGCGQLKGAFGLEGEKKHWLESLIDDISSLGDAQWGSMIMFFPMVIALYVLCWKKPHTPWMTILPCLSIVLGYLAYVPRPSASTTRGSTGTTTSIRGRRL
jgi:SulP family sulfate permease